MKSETKQIDLKNTGSAFMEQQHSLSMAVRGIGVLANVSGGLFNEKGQPETVVATGLSGRPTHTVFPAAA